MKRLTSSLLSVSFALSLPLSALAVTPTTRTTTTRANTTVTTPAATTTTTTRANTTTNDPNYGYMPPAQPPATQQTITPPQTPPPITTLQGGVMTVQSGAKFSVNLNTPVSSNTSRVGDRVQASLTAPLLDNQGRVVLPTGTMVDGVVMEASPAGRADRNGRIALQFTDAIHPQTGQRITMRAKVSTTDGTGIIKANTTGQTFRSNLGGVAASTAIGAGLGTAGGAIFGGRPGRGALAGTAVGLGIGLARVFGKKGDDIALNAGQPMELIIEQPFTVPTP